MRNRRQRGAYSPLAPWRWRAGWVCLAASIAAGAIAGSGFIRGQAQNSPPATVAKPAGTGIAQVPPSMQPGQTQAGTTSGNARKQQLAGECADLLKLATDLKSAVDKSTADQLSVTVVRKAGEIEQLARKVKTANGKS